MQPLRPFQSVDDRNGRVKSSKNQVVTVRGSRQDQKTGVKDEADQHQRAT